MNVFIARFHFMQLKGFHKKTVMKSATCIFSCANQFYARRHFSQCRRYYNESLKPGAQEMVIHEQFKSAIESKDALQAVSLFERILAMESPFTQRRLSQLIHLLCDMDRRHEASNILSHIKGITSHGSEPAFACVILAHTQAGEFQPSLKLFRKARDLGVYVDLLTLQSIIAGLCKTKLKDKNSSDVPYCLVEMLYYIHEQEMVPRDGLYLKVLKHVVKLSNYEAASKIFEIMEKSNKIPSARLCKSIYTSLLYKKSPSSYRELVHTLLLISQRLLANAKQNGVTIAQLNDAENEYNERMYDSSDNDHDSNNSSSDSDDDFEPNIKIITAKGTDDSEFHLHDFSPDELEDDIEAELSELRKKSSSIRVYNFWELREMSDLNYLRKMLVEPYDRKVNKNVTEKLGSNESLEVGDKKLKERITTRRNRARNRRKILRNNPDQPKTL